MLLLIQSQGEDKVTKRAEVIYQSKAAKEREQAGIEKMFLSANAVPDEKLVKAVYRMNVKFGKYHTIEQLANVESLFKQCSNKREESLVEAFCKEWKRVF